MRAHFWPITKYIIMLTVNDKCYEFFNGKIFDENISNIYFPICISS